MYYLIQDTWGYWSVSKAYTLPELQQAKLAGVIRDFRLAGFGSLREAEIAARNLNRRGKP